MSTVQSRTVRLRRWRLCAFGACLLATLGLGLPVADAAGLPGVLITVNGRIRCTGFNTMQKGADVYAITAAHCLVVDKPITITEANTGILLGEAVVVFKHHDLAVLKYAHSSGLATLPLTASRPTFGAVLWGCGVLQEEREAICFAGLWSGDTVTYQDVKYPVATLPVRAGFSGGPIGYGDSVFAIYSLRIDNIIVGSTLVGPAITFLEGVK